LDGSVFFCGLPESNYLVWLSGTVFIDRGNRDSALKSLAKATEDMKNRKQSVWIFVEGTRSYAETPILLPFKKGAFHLAIEAGVPIVPVVVGNYSNLYSPKNRRFESGSIKIRGIAS
jgi:lysophosphatidate acyltransferase